MAADLEGYLRRPRLLAYAAGGAVGLALLGLAVWLGSGRRDAPAPGGEPGPAPSATPPAAPEQPGRPRLAVRVWQETRYTDVADSLPLQNGDEVQVVAEVAPGLHAALFLFNSAGELERLAAVTPGEQTQTLRYPPDAGKSVPLEGPAGTEVVLVCGRRDRPVSLEELRGVWGEAGRWPELAGQTLLGLERDRVVVVAGGRGFGAAQDRADPEGEVRRRLETLREALRGRFDWFEGLAFGHR
jgi:hypothetical protein